MCKVTLSTTIGTTELIQLIHKEVNNAKEYKLTAEELRERVNNSILIPLQRKYSKGKGKSVHSQYLKAFSFGVYLSETTRILHEDVEFCYSVAGELYSTFKDTIHKSTKELYALNRGEELLTLSGNYYWKNTNKVYF